MKKLNHAFCVAFMLMCTYFSYSQHLLASPGKSSIISGKPKINIASLKINGEVSSGKMFKKLESTQPAIYPNPVKEFLNVKNVSPDVHLEIISILGKPISHFSRKSSVEVSTLPTGIYYLKVVDQDTTCVLRFIKQ